MPARPKPKFIMPLADPEYFGAMSMGTAQIGATTSSTEKNAAASEIAISAGMQSGDLLITKRHWGAFAQTPLEEELRSRGVETIVIAGIATNIGVESTLRQGTGLGFHFITVEDACTTFSPEMQDFAFKTIFPRLSHVRTTQQVLEAIA